MSYINLTFFSVVPIEHSVIDNLVNTENLNCAKRHLLARGAYLALTPLSFVTNAIDAVVGIGAGVGAILTVGKSDKIYRVALEHLQGAQQILALSFTNLLHTINPQARFSRPENDPGQWVHGVCIRRPRATIGVEGNGFISNFFISRLRKTGSSCYRYDGFLMRHIASRLTYALLAIACLITRTVDGIIGVLAAVLSLVTVGKFESLNNLAYRALQAPGIIHDLFYCTIKFINPWAGTSAA
jgi:hypothetical protein